MLDEYVIVPDIFDPASYSNPALIDVYLTFLKEPLLQEALVSDLCNGNWSKFCKENSGNLHRLCKEILKKLNLNNRLHLIPCSCAAIPTGAMDWCQEGVNVMALYSLTGVIVSQTTKRSFPAPEVSSIEKLTGTIWWQNRSPSVTVDRKTKNYMEILCRVLLQANSLMFIDPNLDPSSYNYNEFVQLLAPLASRAVKPSIEIHRSLCKGDGPSRTFPTVEDWRKSFSKMGQVLLSLGITAEIFGWDDFHDRWLIADVLGISIPAGFDVTSRQNDYSTWCRLGRDDKDRIQREFDPAKRQPKWRFSIGA